MVSLFAVDTGPGRTERRAPIALLQVVDPVLYDLDAAVAWFVEADVSETATPPMIEAALIAIEDAIERVVDTTDALELAAIAEQLPPASTQNVARRATELGSLLIEFEAIEERRLELRDTKRGRRVAEEITGVHNTYDLDHARDEQQLERRAEELRQDTKVCCRAMAVAALARVVRPEF